MRKSENSFFIRFSTLRVCLSLIGTEPPFFLRNGGVYSRFLSKTVVYIPVFVSNGGVYPVFVSKDGVYSRFFVRNDGVYPFLASNNPFFSITPFLVCNQVYWYRFICFQLFTFWQQYCLLYYYFVSFIQTQKLYRIFRAL